MKNNLFDIARQKMAENGIDIDLCDTEFILETVSASSANDIVGIDDYFFLANFFVTSGLVSGNIVGDNRVIDLTSIHANTEYYKHKEFTGQIKITNSSATVKLYVEFYRVSIPADYEHRKKKLICKAEEIIING